MQTLVNDKTMRDTVVRELEWDSRLDASRIGVTAKDGAIVLSGDVSAYPEKDAAVRAAERVYGVRAVADDLKVKLPGTSLRDDADIADELARAVKWNSIVPDDVQAEVRNGFVTLRGEVAWAYQRHEAQRAAGRLSGVHSVHNEITIKSHLPKAADVDQRVSEAIERMADLDARSIWVTTSNGTVHLHGHVHSLAERRTAERAAASAPGVTHVENDIRVNP